MNLPLYANTLSQNSIFPNYTGIRANTIGTRINVRKYPDLKSTILMNINQEDIQVVGQNQSWYKVIVRGESGWIYKDLVSVTRPEMIPYSKVDPEEIISYGMQFIGTPYVWGGSNLGRGVDCSGFTQEVFKAFEIPIDRVSYMQANEGTEVSKNNLLPGDLVFFDTTGSRSGKISHVGIYIGEDQFLHADATRGVMVSNLKSNYYTRNYVKAVRVL
jgi:cell wall-associated NlpC family hydrolase